MIIRPYRDADLNAIQQICYDTALVGQPIDPILKDKTFVTQALLRYYTDFERKSLLVAEESGEVVGYLTGCRDARRYARDYTLRILPGLIRRFFAQGHWRRVLLWRLLAALGRSGYGQFGARRSIASQYPAHCHLNVRNGFRRSGAGSALLEHFLRNLQAGSVPGLHAAAGTEAGKAFFLKAGFRLLCRHPTPRTAITEPGEVWILGKKIVDEPTH